MNNIRKKKIPIGIGSYKRIRTEGYYYVDKTKYIEIIENLDTVCPVLLRPRRFGKTLFADMLGVYYDIKEQDNFEQLFGDTYIGRHKTSLANSYYVLHFDFSGMNTGDIESLKASFSVNIKGTIQNFLRRYDFSDISLSEDADAADYLNAFLLQLKSIIQDNLYIIIDEYDHFANAILSDQEAFDKVVNKDGFVRSFYEILKMHTKDVLKRIFITGVTSLTLDSLTSGFNISTNVSNYTILNEALGFTALEAEALLRYMGIPEEDETLQIFKEYYNGYLFSEHAQGRVYNSNLILYYLDTYRNAGKPYQLADPNITGDYTKLAGMFDLYDDASGREQVLQSLMNDEHIQGNLVTSFSIATRFSYDHFISLLYYLGLLTIEKRLSNGIYEFRIPNRVIKDVYYDYYYAYLTKNFDITERMIAEALESLETEQDIVPVSELVEKVIAEFTRDNSRYLIHFRENSLHTFFYLMLRKSRKYIARMEYRIHSSGQKRYIDIYYEAVNRNQISYAIELKYITPAKYAENNSLLEHAITETEQQLSRDLDYLKDNAAASQRYAGIGIVFVGGSCRYRNVM